ncbi:MAG: site-specific DNA-methyltransferase, partial [Alphaproteobacteria bacterium]|nr:site-specific DNA-methyltransferase [Alphaproteobacteria bacterium]
MTNRETMPLPLDDLQGDTKEGNDAPSDFRDLAFSSNRSEPVHRWVPWIAGYSRQFVTSAIDMHMDGPGAVLDPFAGVGTTLVEADRKGHESVGFEINPYAAFAARTKLAAHLVDTERLRDAIGAFEYFARDAERCGREPHATPPSGFSTRAAFYSPEVQWKVLTAQDFIAGLSDYLVADFFRLAFASTMVTYSNYSYEPSLGRKATAGRPDVDDYPVFAELAEKLTIMAADADFWKGDRDNRQERRSKVHGASFFEFYKEVERESVDLLITSPPYLNNYHYNRNTRPHLYWLGFCNSPKDFKKLEQRNFGTYWQTARDMEPVSLDPAIANNEIDSLVSDLR